MEKKFNFVYLTTNLINGKQYIGDHSTNDLESSYSKKYLGTGQIILDAVKKYGKKNFKREILENFETKQQAFDAQEKYIKEYNTLNPNGYNISPKGGHNVKECFSEESKQKISKNRSGINSWNKGKTNVYSSETLKQMSAVRIGKPNEKISKVLKGRKPWNKGKTNVYTSETLEEMSKAASKRTENKNGFFGKKHSSKTIELMKLSHKNSKGENNGNAKIKNNDIIIIKKLINDGISIKEIALKYKVTPATIYNIKKGKR